MKDLKDIFEIIEKENIIFEESNIQYGNMSGIYLNIPNIDPVICISTSIINNRCKYLSVISEELGHHFTTVGNLTVKSQNYSEKLQKEKRENKAKLWASKFLISDEDFVQALHKCISNHCDMCDYFNVTSEILKFKVLSIVNDENKYNNIRSSLRKKYIAYNSCCI